MSWRITSWRLTVAGIGRFRQLSSRDWIDLGFDIEATGFALGEIEVILDEAAEAPPTIPWMARGR
jgi:hypothetical protein